MQRVSIALIIIVTILVLIAYGNWSNENSVFQEGVEYYMATDTTVYVATGQVWMRYKITNLRNEPITFNFYSSQRYDFLVNAGMIWRWSYGLIFLPFIWDLTLQPGESTEAIESWDMQDNQGNPVPPGNYTCTGTYTYSGPTPIPVSVSILVVETKDAGVTQIIAPSGTIDSSTVVTPQAKVKNFGNVPESFPVTFSIGTFYTNTQNVSNLNPGDSIVVNFTQWTATHIGTHTTKCTTALIDDQNQSNDLKTSTVTVISPPETVDVWIPDTSAFPGDTIAIPILVSDVTGRGVICCDLTIIWDADWLTADSAYFGSVVPSGWSSAYSFPPETVRIAMAGSNPLVGSGDLLWIRFVVSGSVPPGGTTIHFARCEFNEGSTPTKTDDGLFSVIIPTETVYVWIPDTMGHPGDTVAVPIMVSNVTGWDLISCDMELTWDANLLTAVGVTLGAVVPPGWLIQCNIQLGRITIVMAGANPLVGSGDLLWIQFVVSQSASPGDSTLIHFAQCPFPEPILCNCTDGWFKVVGYISGYARYYSGSHQGVLDVSMIISEQKGTDATFGITSNSDLELKLKHYSIDCGADTTLTDSNGYYIFKYLHGYLDYKVGTEKNNTQRQPAVSSYDAALVLKHVVGQITLDSLQLIAGDVSGNGSISSYDAALILQYAVSVIQHFPVGDWTFRPENRTYDTLRACYTNQNYAAILYGDVSGNWSPIDFIELEPKAENLTWGGNLPTKEEEIEFETRNVECRIQNTEELTTNKRGLAVITETTKNTDFLIFPIKVSNVKDVISADIVLTYNPDVIEIKDVTLGNSTADNLIAWANSKYLVRIALAGTRQLNGNIELAKVSYTIKGENEPELTGPIHIHSIVLNEEEPIITKPSDDGVASNQIELPNQFYLAALKPNPFGNVTCINYGLPKESNVKLAVFDAVGRNIRTLVESKQPAGKYSIIWNGKDEQQQQLGNCIYFIRLQTDKLKLLRKAILLKQ